LEGKRRYYPLSQILVALGFALYSIVKYFEGDPVYTVFIWFTITVGSYVIISFLELRGRVLNQKVLVTLLLLITLGGGILVNIYIFSTSSSFSVRIFSMGTFVLILAVYTLGILASLRGRRDLSKKILNWILDR
jgi:hypothetical protein